MSRDSGQRVSTLASFTRLALVAALAFVVGGLAVLSLTAGSSGRVVASFGQPESVDYGSYDPYTLFVIEQRPLSRFLARRSRHQVRIVRGSDPTGYGHYIDISLDFTGHASDTFVKGSRVDWMVQGVSLETPSGHRLFIPKRAFIGGR